MLKEVTHYGLHEDPKSKIRFLIQGRNSSNAIGASARSPFKVVVEGASQHCNHQIPIAAPVPHQFHWKMLIERRTDELVQAMLPLPKRPCEVGNYFIEGNSELEMIATNLVRMSSPIYNPVQPIWTQSYEKIRNILSNSNIQPVVLTGVTKEHTKLVKNICQIAAQAPRRLILIGESNVSLPSNVERIDTALRDEDDFNAADFIVMPWESIGAMIIRKYMRGEWANLGEV